MTSRDPIDDAASPQSSADATPGILRSLYDRVTTGRRPYVVSLTHEEYEGRNVLSIVARDEYDARDTITTYYDQRVFKRAKEIPPKPRMRGARD